MLRKLLFVAVVASIPTFCSTGLDEQTHCGDFNVVPGNAAPGDTTTVPEHVCWQSVQ